MWERDRRARPDREMPVVRAVAVLARPATGRPGYLVAHRRRRASHRLPVRADRMLDLHRPIARDDRAHPRRHRCRPLYTRTPARRGSASRGEVEHGLSPRGPRPTSGNADLHCRLVAGDARALGLRRGRRHAAVCGPDPVDRLRGDAPRGGAMTLPHLAPATLSTSCRARARRSSASVRSCCSCTSRVSQHTILPGGNAWLQEP